MTTQVDVLRGALHQATQAIKAIQTVSGDFLIKSQSATIQDIATDALALIDKKLNEGAQMTSDLMPEAIDSENNESPYLSLTKNFDEQAIKARVENIGDGWKQFIRANYAQQLMGHYMEFTAHAHADLRAVLRELEAQRFYAREYAETLDMVEARMKSVFPNTDIPFMTYVQNQGNALAALATIWQMYLQSSAPNFASFLEYEIEEDRLDPLFKEAARVIALAKQAPVLPVDASVMQVIQAVKSDNTDGENNVETAST